MIIIKVLLLLPFWKIHCTATKNDSNFVEDESTSGEEFNDQLLFLRDKVESTKDYKKLCDELVKFTPFICDDPLAKTKCTEYCNPSCAKVLPALKCGKAIYKKKQTSKTNTKRMLGGEESNPGQWPWVVDLHSLNLCTGAILTPTFILTAANCFVVYCIIRRLLYKNRNIWNICNTLKGVKFNNPHIWLAYAGGYLRPVREDSETKHNVKKIIIHDKYDPLEYFSSYNLAIVQLETPIKMSKKRRRLCIPDISFQVDGSSECFVTGWAKKSRLNHFEAPIIPQTTCRREFPGDSFHNQIDETKFCAGKGKTSEVLCSGDGGSSLACKIESENRWFSMGVASSDNQNECDKNQKQSRKYSVFANVTSQRSWIIKAILEKSLP